MSVYYVTYKTLGHTHPKMYTAEGMGKHSSHKKGMELERNYLLTLSSNHPKKSLETHEIFHPENH